MDAVGNQGGRDMTEYRLVTFCQPNTAFFKPVEGGANILTVDFARSLPALAEHMDGWEPIGFQITPSGDLAYLHVLLKTEVSPPELDE
jgi:hypothetical protein